MPVQLSELASHLPAWVLVFFRITGVFMMAPLFGGQTIPTRAKIFLAVTLSLCIYPMLLNSSQASAAMIQPILERGLSFWTLAQTVGCELAIGLLIGFGASLPIVGMQMSGHVIGQQIGMGLAEVFSPGAEESGVVSEIYFLTAMAIFIILGGHRLVLMTLVESFDHVPFGGFVADGHMIDLILGLISSMFVLAIRLSGPLLCLVFLETLAMGFIARTVPQMNILSIGFPIRIMLGVTLLIGSFAIQASVFTEVMRQTLRTIHLYFTGS